MSRLVEAHLGTELGIREELDDSRIEVHRRAGIRLDGAGAKGRDSRVRARISFSADESLVRKIEEIRGMMSKGHRTPALEEVFEKLAEEYLERYSLKRGDERAKARENKKAGAASAAAPATVPPTAPPAPAVHPKREALRADVARAVRVRDGYRCTFVSKEGVRCSETRGLEIDHVQAVALGGAVNDLENARLRCRLHNAFAAIEAFGPEFMARWVRPVGTLDHTIQSDPLSIGDPSLPEL